MNAVYFEFADVYKYGNVQVGMQNGYSIATNMCRKMSHFIDDLEITQLRSKRYYILYDN